MSVLIFDFDGTIADSFDVIMQISNRLATEFGYPIAHPEDIEMLKNLGSREVVRRSGISRWKLPFLLRRLQRELNQEMSQLHLFPDMKETLLTLHEQGHRLGIVTSNSCDNVNAFLALQNLSPVFDFVGSGVSLFGKGRMIRNLLRRYRLNSTEVLYIGDETRDIEAAHKIGISSVAVTWGFNSRQALADRNPDYVIDSPQELLRIVSREGSSL